MERIAELLLALIRFEIRGEPLDDALRADINENSVEKLFELAQRHDIAHLISDALGKNGLSGIGAQEKFQKALMQAIFRYANIEHEQSRICDTLEAEGIDYIPLKGALIRELYPEPYMRTSCDIDILVKECDLERAAGALAERLSYKKDGGEHYHDISLYSESGVHLELHFNILENTEGIDALLGRVWEYSERAEGASHRYLETKEFFLFHHIAHMSYHFAGGGCGIRPFLDLYLMREKLEYDEREVERMCSECGIGAFYQGVRALTAVWLEGKTHTELTRLMQSYLLFGGAFGSLDNKIAVEKSSKKMSRARYILSRIFLPYPALKGRYPVLEKHKYLVPVFTVVRWFDILRPSKRRSISRELEINRAVDESKTQNISRLFYELEIKKD